VYYTLFAEDRPEPRSVRWRTAIATGWLSSPGWKVSRPSRINDGKRLLPSRTGGRTYQATCSSTSSRSLWIWIAWVQSS